MLTDAHRALFTSMQECPAEYYSRAVSPLSFGEEGSEVRTQPKAISHQPPILEFIKVKTHLYDLSPYDETLFLDVDMYLLPHVRISEVMSSLSAQCAYTIKNRGWQNLAGHYTHWFDVEQARRHYQTEGRFYQSQSEFIFFKKNEKIKAFFDKVREVFDTRPIACADFRGSVSDEYAYNIAMALTGTYPHQDGYVPIYWYHLEGRHDWNKKVVPHYLGISLGGDSTPDWIIQKANTYRQFYKKALKLPHLFNIPPKRRWNGK
jgi:hypothetical protein